MRSRFVGTLAVAALATASPLRAQRGVIDLTKDLLDRWLNGSKVEKTEQSNVAPQLADIDEKIRKFRECKTAWESAGNATGSSLGGFAARMAIRAKCGASDEDGFQKDRQKILDGPLNDAAKTAGMKLGDYANLRDKLYSYMGGDRSGFTKPGLDVLSSRTSDLESALGISVVQSGGPAGGMGGAAPAMPGVWSQDYAWQYVGYLFAMEYASGASTFEKPYQPGEWTRWSITTSDGKEAQTIERAFLAKTDQGEWWRYKTTAAKNGDAKQGVDTVVLEALFKSDNQYYKTLVRMRGKLPGNADAQEMMVPQAMTTVMSAGVFGQNRPTPESIDGATVGTDKITVSGTSVDAKHVRYGVGSGNLDWWLSDGVPGGWLKFSASSTDKKELYVLTMTDKGTGAKSETGVKLP